MLVVVKHPPVSARMLQGVLILLAKVYPGTDVALATCANWTAIGSWI